jgi:nitrite reductase/ring-hydroxylating ferredoxin subunit
LYVVTGDSGNGMTHGTIAGLLLTDLIQGRQNSWSSLYDPSRITANALGDYASESLNVAAQYGDWLTEADIDSRDQIAPSSGATIRDGASKTAVYRDEHGIYHEFSAVCPHLGGILSWNDTEKSWDCPCHGSRFDCYGKVVNGPANRNMDAAGSLAPVLTAAGVGLQTVAYQTANGIRKLITLGIRKGG